MDPYSRILMVGRTDFHTMCEGHFRAKAHLGFALVNSALKGGVNAFCRIKGDTGM
jgi:hypothetical protein